MIIEPSEVWEYQGSIDWINLLREGIRWAVVAPHPDDELLMAYGFMRGWPDTGRVIVVTDGAQGIEHGFETMDESDLVSSRYCETLRAVAALGMKPHQVVFLGEADGHGATATPGSWERSVEGALRRYDPHIILSPHPLELHPDHRRVGKIIQGVTGNFLRLFTCWPRGLSLGPAAYELKLFQDEWCRKQDVAITYATQRFVSERLANPFYSVERFWMLEQLPSCSVDINDGGPIYSGVDVLSNPVFRYLIDSSEAKRKRVVAAIDAKVTIGGVDPWCFRVSDAEQKRIHLTVDMLLSLKPVHVVDCGCANGEMLRVLASKWRGQAVGIESNQHMARAAQEELPDNITIIIGDFIQELSALTDIDTLVLTELCYYIHPVEWMNYCSEQASRARAVIFSMRPASAAITYLTPLLQCFRLVNVNIVCRKDERQSDGWIIVSLKNNEFLSYELPGVSSFSGVDG